MTDLRIQRPTRLTHWWKLHRLYCTAFPASERKPFSIIMKMYRKGRTDIWCIQKGGQFLGLAITINGEDVILLDYFAIDPAHRGLGLGSGALKELQRRYNGKGLFLEIESVYDDAPNNEERLQRKQFYLRCGMEPLKVMVRLFGVKMELLGYCCRMDYESYHAFYRDNYSPWAAQHISEEAYPQENQERSE